MNYRIGFCGAHRVGKTTTTESVSKALNIPFIKTKVGQSSVWGTVKPSDNMTFAERYHVQHTILEDMEYILRSISAKEYILDRTPYDILAYLLTNIDSTTSEIFDVGVDDFIARCILLSKKYFSHFVVIQPGIPFIGEVNKIGKVYSSIIYQEALTNCIIGSLVRYENSDKIIIVPDDKRTIKERTDFIIDKIETEIVDSIKSHPIPYA